MHSNYERVNAARMVTTKKPSSNTDHEKRILMVVKVVRSKDLRVRGNGRSDEMSVWNW